MHHSRYPDGLLGQLFFGKDLPPTKPPIHPLPIAIVSMLVMFVFAGIILAIN